MPACSTAAGSDGIGCDTHGRAVGIERAYAIGDVAAWPDPRTGRRRRTKHWTSARTQAAAVAADIVGGEIAPPEPPYFWTDQFGLKIQVVGDPERADRTTVIRPADGAVRNSVVLYLRSGVLVAAALFSAARHLGALTAAVRDGADEPAARAVLSA